MIFIYYMGGTVRTINPADPSFYSPTVVVNKNGASLSLSVEKKVEQLALDYGHKPYRIEIARPGREIRVILLPENSPIPEKPEKKVDEKEVKRQLRREFRHVPVITYLHERYY